MSYNGTPIPLGSAQAVYFDQPGAALAGTLYSSSDYNLTDSIQVAEAAGIACGRAVVISRVASPKVGGINDKLASLPTSGTSAIDGVLVHAVSARSDANGIPYIPYQRGAMVLGKARVGGRIWVKAYNAATAGATALVRIKADVVGETTTPVGGFVGTAITGVTPAVAASGTMTFAGNPADADTVTVGDQVYRFKGTMASANDVKLESTLAATLAHLIKAINGTGTEGVDYYAGTSAEATVLSAVNGSVVSIVAVTAGTAGNSIALAESGSVVILSGATLAGGAAAATTTDTISATGFVWDSSAASGGIALLVVG